jgi:hypothetical protein
MKKSDIKNGMHVITRNGVEYVIISGVEACKQIIKKDVIMTRIDTCGGWMPFDRYDDDLNYYNFDAECGDEDFDICEVYVPNFYADTLLSVHDDYNSDKFTKVWERPIVVAKKMTKAEIEAELGYEIEIVD